jgi:hypothetical protein
MSEDEEDIQQDLQEDHRAVVIGFMAGLEKMSD